MLQITKIMYKRIIIITITIAAVFLISACEEWLDLKPENYVIKQDFWQTKQQVHSAVIGCYASLLNESIANRFFLWGELRGDMLSYNYGIYNSSFWVLYGYIMPWNKVIKWESMYKSINICNTVIDYAKDALVTDNTFTEIELT